MFAALRGGGSDCGAARTRIVLAAVDEVLRNLQVVSSHLAPRFGAWSKGGGYPSHKSKLRWRGGLWHALSITEGGYERRAVVRVL